MAVIRYKCTTCDRNIEIIEQPTGLERIGPCVITDRCRGSLYKVDRLEDYAVGQFPEDVSGLTNYIRRNVLYNHTQAIAEQEWLVNHDLGVNPSVQVVVNREETVDGVIVNTRPEIEPQLITLIDSNTLRIRFDRPESGLAQVQARSSAFTQTVETVDPGITYLPVSHSNTLTIAADLSSNQFPEGTTTGTCSVRIYYLDQETLDETAFDSAVFKDYDARSPINTSAWNDVSEIFVNGQLYTVLTIDIGDPVEDIGAPSAGTTLFQAGTSTSGFAYDQAPNMVVLLSQYPHTNSDKVRNSLFRPDLSVGPAKTLDSFIFADGEISVDETKVEEVFPPIFAVTNPQDHPEEVVPVVVVDGFVQAFGNFGSEGGLAEGVAYTSDNDVDVWTGMRPIPGSVSFPSFGGGVYAEDIDTWVILSKKGTTSSAFIYSTDDGVTWTAANSPTSTATASGEVNYNMAYSPSLGRFIVGCNSGQIVSSTDGISWSNVTPGIFGSAQVWSVHWSTTLGMFIACTNANDVATSATGTSGWTLVTNEPGGAGSSDLNALYSIGSRVFVSNQDSEAVYYSDDIDGAGGGTWTQATVDVKPSFNAGGFAANTDGSVLLWAGPGSNSGGYVWRSTDNGENFTRVDFSTGIGLSNTSTRSYSVAHDPDYGFMVGGGEYGGSPTYHYIATSPDGLTWTLRLSEKFVSDTANTQDINLIVSKNQTIDI